MKRISVGELRQNLTQMLDDVARGETCIVTRHNREVARIVPTVSSATVLPPRDSGASRTSDLPRIDLPDGLDFEDLLAELKGVW